MYERRIGKTYYVNSGAVRTGNGSKEAPFRTINEVAQVAYPGDEVIVASGEYREKVAPKYSDNQ